MINKTAQIAKCACPTCTCSAATNRPARREPEPLRPVAVTAGGFREILWQHSWDLNRRDSPESAADLRSFVIRDPRLDHIMLDDPAAMAKAERLRLDAIVAAIEINKGWAAGGTVWTSRGKPGWPQGFISRTLRPQERTRNEIAWVASVAGLKISWRRVRGGHKVALMLPGVAIPPEAPNHRVAPSRAAR
jgi:hypothetical protein